MNVLALIVLLPRLLATSISGELGALAAHSLSRLVAWPTVSSAGTMLASSGLFITVPVSANLMAQAALHGRADSTAPLPQNVELSDSPDQPQPPLP